MNNNADHIFDETFLARWVAGELSQEELKNFESHPDYAIFNDIANSASQLQAPALDKSSVLAKIKSQKKKKLVKLPPRRRILQWVAVAAAIFLGAFILFGLNNSHSVNTGIAETKSIELPDGSRVVLNANSSIAYNEKDFTSKRNVYLEGEAYFDVTSGPGFEIESSNGIVTVLGTTFNIRNLEKVFEVQCATGKVNVESKHNNLKVETLNAGDQIQIDRIGRTIRSSGLNEFARWRNGQSNFTSVSLGLVIEELKNQYDISIDISNVDLNEKFTGAFIHGNLTQAMQSIFPPMGINYKITGNKIRISME